MASTAQLQLGTRGLFAMTSKELVASIALSYRHEVNSYVANNLPTIELLKKYESSHTFALICSVAQILQVLADLLCQRHELRRILFFRRECASCMTQTHTELISKRWALPFAQLACVDLTVQHLLVGGKNPTAQNSVAISSRQ